MGEIGWTDRRHTRNVTFHGHGLHHVFVEIRAFENLEVVGFVETDAVPSMKEKGRERLRLERQGDAAFHAGLPDFDEYGSVRQHLCPVVGAHCTNVSFHGQSGSGSDEL